MGLPPEALPPPSETNLSEIAYRERWRQELRRAFRAFDEEAIRQHDASAAYFRGLATRHLFTAPDISAMATDAAEWDEWAAARLRAHLGHFPAGQGQHQGPDRSPGVALWDSPPG